MKHKIIILIIFSLVSLVTYAGIVPISKAREAAKNHYYKNSDKPNLKFSDIKISSEISVIYNNKTVFYVFNISSGKGFVIISAEENCYPVLSYSYQGNFNYSDPKFPDAYKFWLEQYKKQIDYISTNTIENTEAVIAWNNITTNYKGTKETTDVAPLLDPIKWNQICHYNALCPEDAAAGSYYCDRCPTGCVATAMSQILKFWEYPTTGVGQHSYTHATYGAQSANFGTTTYNWANMPDEVTSANADVATVLYHCGVSVEMDYAPDGSGASTWDAKDALVNNFKYSPDAIIDAMASHTDAEWKTLLKADLDAGWPIIYSGNDPAGGSGHAFICDGYQATDHFHFNWGWGGSYNSYNYLTSLVPGGTGTGGGSGDYTADQDAILHIHPASDYYPIADFVGTPTTVVVGGTVNFTDLSTFPGTDSITAWHWYFQGGTPGYVDTTQNPVIQYNATGINQVTLAVFNSHGSDSIIKTAYITVIEPSTELPQANFAANFTNIMVGGTVNFTDLSHGNPLYFEWTFDGGTPATSTDEDPQGIVYNTAGDYFVKLKATNTLGSDSLTKVAYIHVLSDPGTLSPVADFTAGPRLVTIGEPINFTDLSTNNPLQWNWYFPNGTPDNSSDQNPIGITYASAGFYNVTLTATNPNGSSSKIKNEYILVTSTPITSYCDTMSNVGNTENIWYKTYQSGWGYVPGTYKYGKVYAEKFTNQTFSQIDRIIIPVAKKKASALTSKVKFYVWNGNTLPDSVLGTITIPVSGLSQNVYNLITFDTPINVGETFFVGYDVTSLVSTDTMIFYMANDRGTYGLNTAYVKQNSVWKSFTSALNISTSLEIKIIPCLVGAEKNNFSDKINIYPNPADDFVIIDFGDEISNALTFEIFDIMGKKIQAVYDNNSDTQYIISTENMTNGVYLLNITNKGKTISKRITVVK